jgi:16S rRNA (uracil1498-N3)-methyltransferase
MAIRDFSSQRVFLDTALAAGVEVVCSSEQASYLRSVMRMDDGSGLLVFNGRDGEWRALLRHQGKRGAALHIVEQIRAQEGGPDLWYVFAPLKRSRLDYMVQKAVEMGASRLMPILTQHTVAERVNVDRMAANAIEAAEQCGVLRIAEVAEPVKLAALLQSWPDERALIFCDEGAPQTHTLHALAAIPRGPLAVLIGPEGGFSETERQLINGKPFAHAISLGPRIMRADTAAVAALAVVNAVLGDWA